MDGKSEVWGKGSNEVDVKEDDRGFDTLSSIWMLESSKFNH